MPTPSSLRARWRGENNANEVTGTYNGTVAGSLGYAPGKHGNAFTFDGTDDVVTADAGEALWPAGSFSIELWMKTTVMPTETYAALVQKYDCAGTEPCTESNYGMYLTNTGRAFWDFRAPGGSSVAITATSGNLVDGAWHHLVGVRDVTAKQTILYVDGQLAVSSPLDDSALAAMANEDGGVDPFTIGVSRTSGITTLSHFYVGAIDEPAYYISALPAAEVSAAYAAPMGYCP